MGSCSTFSSRNGGTNRPPVWSRDEVVRVDLEGCRVLGPGLADGLERGSPSQPLEVLGEVVGRDKGQDVGLQALPVGVMEHLEVASFAVRFIRSAWPFVQGLVGRSSRGWLA